MPGSVIRIILFMAVVIFSSFMYELNYSNKAVDVTGKIVSITNKSKGKNIVVSLTGDKQGQRFFTFSVGPIIYLIEGYNVGGSIPIKYCKACSPMAKIGDTPNIYALTFMMLILAGVVLIVFIIAWLKGKKTSV